MGNKINVSELLKNCPQGMELDCTMFEDIEFDSIVDDEYCPIRCRIKHPDGGYNIYNFTKYGYWNNTYKAKCVIFPKGKTTWEGFHRPFKDGDILAYTSSHTTVFIYRNKDNEPKFTTSFYVGYTIGVCYCDFHIYNQSTLIALNGDCDVRLATEEEKAKLFKAIKDNGYRWNPETKTLEKLIEPIFKVGDRIRCKNDTTTTKIIGYIYHDSYALYDGHLLLFKEQDQYELVPDKFDIAKLKPFDEVLVRDFDSEVWEIDFFSKLLDGKHFKCHGSSYVQCIPYKGNEYLHNTTNACSPFYKTWEK